MIKQNVFLPVEKDMARMILLKLSTGYNFELVTSDHQKLLTGYPYPTAAQCIRVMIQIKNDALNQNCYRKFTSPDNRHYFVVLNTEGTIVASSDFYWSQTSMEVAFQRVQRTLLFAELSEE